MAAHQAPPSLGFSRQEHWSGLPLPSPMHESEKWKWSRSVVSDSSWPHGLQPTRLLHPWDFPGKSTGVGCHCLLKEGLWRSKALIQVQKAIVTPFIGNQWKKLINYDTIVIKMSIKMSIFIPIPKKGNAKECSNYCTVVLISHASKVMLKIFQARLKQYMNWEFPDVQVGFRKGKGTLEKEMATHSSILLFAWEIPWAEKPGNYSP